MKKKFKQIIILFIFNQYTYILDKNYLNLIFQTFDFSPNIPIKIYF